MRPDLFERGVTVAVSGSIKGLSKRHGVLAVLIVAALAAIFFFAHAAYGPATDVYPVTRSDLLQTIVASGRVETPLRVDIGSQLTGTVAAVPVEEGQTVKKGQLLIALENSEATAAVEQARAAVEQAQTRLRQLQQVALPVARQGLRQAQFNLDNVRRQYARAKELHSKGFVGQSALDDAQHNLDLAESQLRTAELQVATNSPGGSDVLMAKAAFDQAQASLRMAAAKLDYTTIESPADGTLIARDVERGDVVQPGKALMRLSPVGRTQLVVQIDEKNLASIHAGQSALASADAFPQRRFSATLVYINPAVDPQRGSVEVKLDVPQPPDYLRQDMTVSVDIEVARRQNAVVAAAAAVHDAASDAPWVMKVADGRARRQPVRIGLRGRGLVEIVSGLQPGDLLIPATAGISDGQRVRAQRKDAKPVS
jgi:HlyD family secretion protein